MKELSQMPSHLVHVKWSKKIVGKARPEVDRFLDEFIKEIDLPLLKECIYKCKEHIKKFNIDEIEELLKYYENNLGIHIDRYNFGLVFYTQLDLDMQIRLAQSRMRIHDTWRFFDYCIVLEYIERKFGVDGAKVAVVHMVLDEIARLARIDYADARKGVEAILTCLSSLQKEYLSEILRRMISKIDEIIIDVSFSVGINFLSRKMRKMTVLSEDEEIPKELDMLSRRYSIQVNIINPLKLNYAQSYTLYKKIKDICSKLRVNVRVLFDKIIGRLMINDKLLLVSYSNGTEVVYPHRVGVYPVGEVTITVEDFIRSTEILLGMMRPGSMRGDYKGGL